MVVSFLAKQIVQRRPLSIWLDWLDSPLEELDVILNYWALFVMDNLSDTDLALLFLKKLKNLLIHSEKLPFWRNLFQECGIISNNIHVLRDIEKLRPVSRVDLALIPLEYRSHGLIKNSARGAYGRSSGTTGSPIDFYYDRKARVRIRAVLLKMIQEIMNLNPIKVFFRKPRVVNLGVSSHINLYPWVHYLPADDLHKSPSRFIEKFSALIRESKPEILYTNATYLKQLRYIFGPDAFFYHFESLVYTAEHLTEIEIRDLAEFFKCPIYSLYGAREGGLIGIECRVAHQFHVAREWVYVEIIDEMGDRLADGKIGNIVCTFFENDLSPFIRYKIGDMGKIIRNPMCQCGKKSPLIFFEGRSADIIHLPGRKTIACLELHKMLVQEFFHLIRQFQFIRVSENLLVIKIIPKVEFTITQSEVTKAFVEERLNNEIEVRLEIVSTILPAYSGKIPLFVNYLDYNK